MLAERGSPGAGARDGSARATVARYDGLADWYDRVMRDPGNRGELAASAYDLLVRLLGPGTGVILDIGCGTGLAAERVRALGYVPVGIDLSIDQLRVASRRLTVFQGDAARLPVRSSSVAAAYSTFVSSDLDAFVDAVREVQRVLEPGGRYVSVCVHPCFNGGDATRHADGSVSIRPEYTQARYRTSLELGTTIRSQVGAWHRPLGELVNTYLDAGLQLAALVEGGPDPLPSLLGIAVVKPGPDSSRATDTEAEEQQ